MSSAQPVALVTGGARRIGSVIVEALHAAGYRVVIHCRHSKAEAGQLATRLDQLRADSAAVVAADLAARDEPERLVSAAVEAWGRLDLLVNNASSFFPTPVGKTSNEQWDDLVGSNLRAPFFVSQAAAPHLAEHNGAIVNLIDVHATRPLAEHAVYCAAKAGLHMLTRAMAKELGPRVRVNGVAPGAILWPEGGVSDAGKQAIIDATPLQRTGSPEDIAETVLFLARSTFITGQIIAVDGGRSL